MNIQKTIIFSFLVIIVFLQSACFMPVSNHFETAKTLKKNNLEASVNVSYYEASSDDDGDNDGISSFNYGAQISYGLADDFDFKLRYEYLNYNNKPESVPTINRLFPGIDDPSLHYISISTKSSLIEDKLAFSVPVSFYLNEESTFVLVSPMIIATHTFNQHVDVSCSGTFQVMLNGLGLGLGLSTGINFGMGFSTDLEKWAIRPEVSLNTMGAAYYSAGIGFKYKLTN